MDSNIQKKIQDQNSLSFQLMDALEIAKFKYQEDPDNYMDTVPEEEKERVEAIHSDLQEQSYKIIKYAGKGQFGIVLIVQKETNKNSQEQEIRYAVKCITITNQFGKENKNIVEQAEAEIKTFERCKSEYVVSYLFSFKKQYFYYIFMECCQGTLQSLFEENNKNFNENTFIKFGQDILQGIKDCHNQQVIIRDIKLENILISFQNKAKLSDFGLSGQLNQGLSTLNSSIKGNYLFSAPESIQDHSVDIKQQILRIFNQKKALNQTKQVSIPLTRQGIRSDLYSIGQVLFYLLGGSIIDLNRKQMGDLESGYLPPQKKLINNKKISEIIQGLNEYLPNDRITVEEALQKFQELEFIDTLNNVPLRLQNLLTPKTTNEVNQQSSSVYTMVGNNQFIPLMQIKNISKEQIYPLSQNISNEVQRILKKYNPDNIPVSKMLLVYNTYSYPGFVIYFGELQDWIIESDHTKVRALHFSKDDYIVTQLYTTDYLLEAIPTFNLEKHQLQTKNFIQLRRSSINIHMKRKEEHDPSIFKQMEKVIIPILDAQSVRDNEDVDLGIFIKEQQYI